jgi:hypothetical protein
MIFVLRLKLYRARAPVTGADAADLINEMASLLFMVPHPAGEGQRANEPGEIQSPDGTRRQKTRWTSAGRTFEASGDDMKGEIAASARRMTTITFFTSINVRP